MKACTIIACVGGAGKSSFLGILKECRNDLGFAMDFDKNIAEYKRGCCAEKGRYVHL